MRSSGGEWAKEGHLIRAAQYPRVSTQDQPTLGLQVEMRMAYLKGRGGEAVRQVEDVGSGAKKRPAREETTG